jgi:hypothetical protein
LPPSFRSARSLIASGVFGAGTVACSQIGDHPVIVPVLLLGLALILAYIGSRKQVSRVQFLFVFAFFLAGAISVVFSDLTMKAAALLGVGRGADLLLYFSVLCGVLVAANFYFRFKDHERMLSEIVRQMAIRTPQRPRKETAPSK